MMEIIEEKMSDVFTKYHITGLPFSAVLHKFSSTVDENAHDHPFNFISHVLKGSYVERRYYIQGNYWESDIKTRNEGDSFIVKAEDIHEIIRLHENECWTIITPQEKTREPRFWKFEGNVISSRAWNEEEFKIYRL